MDYNNNLIRRDSIHVDLMDKISTLYDKYREEIDRFGGETKRALQLEKEIEIGLKILDNFKW